MTKRYKLDYESPIGIIEIIAEKDAIISILFSEQDKKVNGLQNDTPQVLIDCCQQLDEYFKGARHVFTVPYRLEGTEFQRSVWNALTSIPCGETESYKDIAILIGNESAVRAVGNANGKNKLSIIIPCHRIIGSNGKLTGYAGGLWRKEWLLKHETEYRKDNVRSDKESGTD